jgi:Ribbon-helix-helix protein, copG family
MNEDKLLSESERRAVAQAAEGSIVEPGTGREVPAREMKQMVSVRFEPDLIQALRKLARARGITLSDLVREAAVRLIDEADTRPVRLEVRRVGDSVLSPGLIATTSTTGHRIRRAG